MGRAIPVDARIIDWRTRDGWICRRLDWPRRDGGHGLGRLVFAGGRGDFIEKYLEAYHHWHRRGWNVTAFDWRGQGRSRGDRSPQGFAAMVDDLAALLEELGLERPLVAIGHSMGGHLLLRTLIERRSEIDAAVLVAPMIRVNASPLPASFAPAITRLLCRIGLADRPVWKSRAPALAPGSRRQQFLTSSRDRYADEAWWWGEAPEMKLGAPSWGWMREAWNSASAWFTPTNFASIDVPLLLIGSDTDRLVDPRAIREAADRLPRAELVMYPEAGHEILREADAVRDDALARIDAFLDEQAR